MTDNKPGLISKVVEAKPAVQVDTGIVGWSLTHTKGCIWLTSERCAQTPLPGELSQFCFSG